MGRGALAIALLLAACGEKKLAVASFDAGPVARAATPAPMDLPPPRTSASGPCPVKDKQDVDGALDEAGRAFDRDDYAVALACAEQAAHVAPRSVEAHHDRADALVALLRYDEAKEAFTMALALDPEDPHTLASAADFYVNRLSPSRDQTEIGLEYARRGSAHVGLRRDDRELAARLALVEAQALDDLSRADEALPRVEAAMASAPSNTEARYERALILFHLVKLDRAKQAFEDVLTRTPDDAFAHHHLGLILEREGREAEAEAHFARARALAPSQFGAPVLPSAVEFRTMIDAAVAGLDPTIWPLLQGVSVEAADLPAVDDLIAVDPPFPPTILGLFRGAALGEKGPAASEPRAILLYRRNLARAVQSREELERQVRITLLHEVGHLTGADEDDLRTRGLE